MILNNPKYYQLLKLGRSTRWCSKKVELPILEPKTLTQHAETSISLYEKQKEIYKKALEKTSSLIELQTGAGKTIIAIALHQALGGRTLVACHTLQLSQQFHDEFLKFIKIVATFYCNGKKDLSGDVVITTHQTLRMNYKLFKDFDNLFLDECDLMTTIKSLKAINDFESKVKIGFTATVKTEYDDCNKIQFLPLFYGNHIKGEYDMSDSPLKHIYYKVYDKRYITTTKKGKAVIHPKDYIKFREVLDIDIPRKRAQLQFIRENTEKGDYVLIMLDRVADVLAFAKYCDYAITGDTKSRDREEILKDFDKNGGLLVATASILSRGFDNIKINKAFVLFPIKGESQIRQLTGRIIRIYKDKESILYIWSDSSLSHQLKVQKKVLVEFFNIIPIEKK